jgi:hypothetical protein
VLEQNGGKCPNRLIKIITFKTFVDPIIFKSVVESARNFNYSYSIYFFEIYFFDILTNIFIMNIPYILNTIILESAYCLIFCKNINNLSIRYLVKILIILFY